MTERYEVTSLLQRELVQDPDIFGSPQPGTPGRARRLHGERALPQKTRRRQTAAGAAPRVFFDVDQQGEGLSDVGTHLVDLIPWMLFPGQPIDSGSDIKRHRRRETLADHAHPRRLSS